MAEAVIKLGNKKRKNIFLNKVKTKEINIKSDQQ